MYRTACNLRLPQLRCLASPSLRLPRLSNSLNSRPQSQTIPAVPPATARRSLVTVPAAAAAVNTMPGSAVVHPEEVKTAKVVVASIPACPYCKRAKEALSQADIPFVDVDVAGNEGLRAKVREVTGRRTVPQIFVDGASIGGADDLLPLLESGSFKELLNSTDAPALPSELMQLAYTALQEAAEALHHSYEVNKASSKLVELAAKLQSTDIGITRTELKQGPYTYLVFSAKDLVGWLLQHDTSGLTQAVSTAQQLLDSHLIAPVSMTRPSIEGAQISAEAKVGLPYTLVADAPKAVQGYPLNGQFWWYGAARPANHVATEIRQLILELYDKHLSSDGRSVSYKGIKTDPAFQTFVKATAELQTVDIKSLSREELMAMFINLYNALIIHGMVVYGTHMNALQRTQFFTKNAVYNIGGLEYTADDMENGVLRGNRSAASNLFNLIGLPQFSGHQFKNGDPRTEKTVQPMDPRIHFALVCGAKSCPPIKMYTPENLEEGLAAAAEAFCQSEVVVNKGSREVTLSKIIKWYGVDFGQNQTQRLEYLLQFLPDAAKQDLQSMLTVGQHIKVIYKEYDWSVNSTD